MHIRGPGLEEGHIECLRSLDNLRSMSVTEARLGKGDMLSIRGMRGLVRLEMISCITDPGILEGIEYLENLRYLYVDGTRLGKADFYSISS